MGEQIMQSFYSKEELSDIKFAYCGDNVKISRNAKFYSTEKMSIGNNVRIDDFCILSGKISIGNNIHIAAYSAIYGGDAGVIICDYSNISSRVSIYALSDDYSGETMTNPTIPSEYKNVFSKQVYIGKHVIIGSTSVVMPGVEIAEGGSFGCFSYINRNSEPWSINVGIPFEKIRNRSRNILELEKIYEKHKQEY